MSLARSRYRRFDLVKFNKLNYEIFLTTILHLTSKYFHQNGPFEVSHDSLVIKFKVHGTCSTPILL